MYLFLSVCGALVLSMSSTAQFNNKRQVLIFGDPQNKLLQQQQAWLNKDTKGLAERDVTITVAGKNDALYKQYKVDSSIAFLFILVGKDTGEKHCSEKPVTTRQLFAIIDAMPMRKAEMKQ
ncbi:MAG: DUF4174 domain-containing protein [Chitinophagaceae bacterium]